MIEKLTESQKIAVTHPGGPLLVLAGAGSGKTRVITSRIAHLVGQGVEPRRIVAVTFTNKAAGEMKERVESRLERSARGLTIRTFHSLCAIMLRSFADRLGYSRNFTILDDRGSRKLFKRIIKDLDLPSSQFKPAAVSDTISLIKGAGETPESYLEFADGYRRECTARIYHTYQRILLETNCMDFDDLLVNVIKVLENEEDVRERYQERILHLLVDEYQDTNRAQYLIARLLSAKHLNICAAGDPDQSIYGWRGAEISNILDFEKDFKNTTIVKLEENWRSCGSILANAQSVIQHNRRRQEKTLIATRSLGENVTIIGAYDEVHESQIVVQRIQEMKSRGFHFEDMAILYRTNAFSRNLEEALRAEKISYQVVQGVEFYNRKEIKDLLSYLDFVVNPKNDLSFERIINTPPRGLGKKAVETMKFAATKNKTSLYEGMKKCIEAGDLSKRAAKSASEFRELIELLQDMLERGPRHALKEIISTTGFENYLLKQENGDDRVENVKELVNAAVRFEEENPEAGLAEYVEQVALVADIDGYEEDSGKVSLMTMHAVKGLEFPIVFICGLEEGLIPHQRSIDDGRRDEIEEERRLLYVGMTRACDKLYITLSRFRNEYGGVARQIESRFLGELDTSRIDLVDMSDDF